MRYLVKSISLARWKLGVGVKNYCLGMSAYNTVFDELFRCLELVNIIPIEINNRSF